MSATPHQEGASPVPEATATESRTARSGHTAPAPEPVTSLHDPRAVQILSTEHWSLLSARSLAYNEAFTRGGMFLTFLSMSFVALALVSQAMSFDDTFLVIAAILLGFDVIIGATTYARITAANQDDLRAVLGMARIRHGYTQIAPLLEPYFTSGTHDDLAGAMIAYGNPNPSGTMLGTVSYAVTTSGGMIGLILSLLVGVLGGVLALLLGVANGWAFVVGAAATVLTFAFLVMATQRYFERREAEIVSLFPTPPAQPPAAG